MSKRLEDIRRQLLSTPTPKTPVVNTSPIPMGEEAAIEQPTKKSGGIGDWFKTVSKDIIKSQDPRRYGNPLQLLKDTNRVAGIVHKGLVGDIPIIRHSLSKEVRDDSFKPENSVEQAAFSLSRLARDFYAGGKLFKMVPMSAGLMSKAGTLPGRLGKVAPGAIMAAENFGKGALFGAGTAGTENPLGIAKNAAQMGAFTTAAPFALTGIFKGVPKALKFANKKLPPKWTAPVKKLGNWAAKMFAIKSGIAPGLQGSVEQRTATLAEMNITREQYLKHFKELFPDENLQKSLVFLREKTHNIPAEFGLSDDVLNLVKNQPMTKMTSAALDEVDNFYRMGGKHVDQSLKILDPKGKLAFKEDYVNRLYKNFSTKSPTEKNAIVQWFSSRNPNTLKRTVKTLVEGHEKFGLIPETTNIVDLMRIYGQNATRLRANAQFVNNLKNFVAMQKNSTATNAYNNRALALRKSKLPKNLRSLEVQGSAREARRAGILPKATPREIAQATELRKMANSGVVGQSQNLSLDDVLKRTYKKSLTGKAPRVSRKPLVKPAAGDGGKDLIIPYDKALAEGMYRTDHPVLVKAFGSENNNFKHMNILLRELEYARGAKAIALAKNKIKALSAKMMGRHDSVLVHKDLEPTIKALFGKSGTNAGGKFYDTASQVFKYTNLTMSGFHPTVLIEGASLNDALPKDLLNPAKIVNALKGGGTYVLAHPNQAKRAIRGGVHVGAPIDAVENALEKVLTGLEKELDTLKNPNLATKGVSALSKGAKAALKAQSRFLWSYLNPSLKVQGYDKMLKTVLKNPKFSKYPRRSVEKAVGEWVNNSYGGQNWETLGIGPEWKKNMARVLLSPDWLTSTNKQWLSAFGVGSTDDVLRNEVLQELGETFWRRAAVVYATSLNNLNRAISQFHYGKARNMWDNPVGQKGNVMVGKDEVTGSEQYARVGKQLKDPLELAFSGGEGAIKKTLSKFGPGVNIPHLFATGKTLGGYETELSRMIERQERGTFSRRFIEVAKALLPYSLQGAVSDEQLNALNFIVPISKGMTSGRARKHYMNIITDAVKRGKKQIKFGGKTEQEVSRDMFTQDEKIKIIALSQAAVNNGLNPNQIWNGAKSRVLSDMTLVNREEAKKILRRLHDKPRDYQQDYLRKQPKKVAEQVKKVGRERVANKKNARRATRSLQVLKDRYSKKPAILKLLPFGSN